MFSRYFASAGIAFFCFFCHTIHAQNQNYLRESAQARAGRMAWWKEARFGMFIHWGLYAVPAGVYRGKIYPGASEWLMEQAHIPVSEYAQYAPQFFPFKYDARRWVEIAKNAGMKYIVITSKHHDGFCLWDSPLTNYDVVDATPYKKDLLAPLAAECERAGIKLCFYHSIMDWHHPDAKGDKFPDYRENYLKPQLKELIERYRPAVLWFDGEWIPEWTEEQGKDLYNYVRSLKPDLIVNNRVGKGRNGMQGMNKEGDYVGDFGTPEQEVLGTASELPWESCMTMNDSWGFKQSDTNWKSAAALIHHLADIAAKGGNYLLNVGPDAQGLIPQASVERLQAMGDWLRVNGEAIYGTQTFHVYAEGEHIRYTRSADGRYVYAIVLKWPGETLKLKYIRPKRNATIEMLGHSGLIPYHDIPQEGISLKIPASLQKEANRPCQHAWVFKLEATTTNVTQPVSFATPDKAVSKRALFGEQVQVVLSCPTPGAEIRYTTDGTEPHRDSPLYEEPFALTQSATVLAKAYKSGKISSLTTSAEFIKTNRFKSLKLNVPPSPNYPGEGELTLADGVRGTDNFRDGNWLGFEGQDAEILIDRGEVKPLRAVRLGLLQNPGSWIFFPVKTECWISEDGENYTLLGTQARPASPQSANAQEDLKFIGQGKAARYVKLVVTSIGKCPTWHAGAGGLAWVFMDEVMVE